MQLVSRNINDRVISNLPLERVDSVSVFNKLSDSSDEVRSVEIIDNEAMYTSMLETRPA